jgi:hypothetical protein
MLGDYPFHAAIHEKIAQSLMIETFDHGSVQPVTGQVSTGIRVHASHLSNDMGAGIKK